MMKRCSGLLLVVLLVMGTLLGGNRVEEARGQQILPGGRAAYFRSYSGSAAGAGAMSFATDSGTGVHGTIITDLIFTCRDIGTYQLQLEGPVQGPVQIQLECPSPQSVHYGLVTGIPIPAGASITVSQLLGGGGVWAVTLTGYAY